MPARDGRTAGRGVGPVRRVARHWSDPVRVVRLSPQPGARDGSPGAVKPNTKIGLGLVLGAVCGVTANELGPDAAWVRWIGDNVAGPVGQVFLRMLLMTVIPLVFTSLALGVVGIGDIRQVGRLGMASLVHFQLATALAAAIGLGL